MSGRRGVEILCWIKAETPGASQPSGMSDAAEETLLAWDHRIRMLANPNLWRAFALVFGAPLTVLGAVLAVTTGWKTGLTALVGGLVLFGALWLIVGVIVDLMGGFRAHYAVTGKAMAVVSCERRGEIFYAKQLWKHGKVTALQMTYPVGERGRWDMALARMAESLKPAK